MPSAPPARQRGESEDGDMVTKICGGRWRPTFAEGDSCWRIFAESEFREAPNGHVATDFGEDRKRREPERRPVKNGRDVIEGGRMRSTVDALWEDVGVSAFHGALMVAKGVAGYAALNGGSATLAGPQAGTETVVDAKTMNG